LIPELRRRDPSRRPAPRQPPAGQQEKERPNQHDAQAGATGWELDGERRWKQKKHEEEDEQYVPVAADDSGGPQPGSSLLSNGRRKKPREVARGGGGPRPGSLAASRVWVTGKDG